ncbi:DUF89 domain-containing protein [Mytilinidion resinicola]|uniref:Sugar phosphate phosphatase n=1 Tax=Mytilinidion resinicola TaxID=574789 RepID=A0A6A6YS08_9PEZI|nr:DUF89 domain-containing protein [Mytilinidion resinicola]KAF2811561.1 DUF89 domain-containing protein [Mytilinidion resinicola]
MEYDTKTPPYHTSDTTSFAYFSARDRWPVIITQAIDDVYRATTAATDPDTVTEGKGLINALAKLKHELQHDRLLTPLPDDGFSDIEGYNKELAALGNPTWFNVPWLFSECYLYRRMNALFVLSKKWKSYDIFARQKLSTFKSSRPAVVELATHYKEIVAKLGQGSNLAGEEMEAAEKVLFMEMCEICLWGNATDLSLLTNLSYEDIQKLQGSSARQAAQANIIANDLDAAFAILRNAQKSGKSADRRVDIILDNAGFELYVDLILAGYLLSSGLATTVILHPKSIPWFVSDVLPKDFQDIIQAVHDPQRLYAPTADDDDAYRNTYRPLPAKDQEDIKFLFQNWTSLVGEGRLLIRPNRFWTEGGSFWRLPNSEPSLFEDLKESELVIFKGDLNYRKLTGDAAWDPTTPFSTAIGPLGPGSGLRTLALRTCKADVVVGLPEGEDERLRKMEGGGGDSGARKWAWSGKWAVVQLCDGKA